MRASRVKRFFRDQHFFSSYVSRLTRAQVCIDGTAGCFAWPCSRGQPPKPGGSRRKARGVDGESARRATIVAGHYAANVTDLPLILFPPFRLRLFNRSKAEPSSLCSNSRCINLYPVGIESVPRSPMHRCEGKGLQGGWDHSSWRRLSAMSNSDHTSTLDSKRSFRSCSGLCAEVF